MAYQKKKRPYEPSPRAYSFSAPLEGKLCVWGGDIDSFHKKTSELTATFKSFDPLMECWSQHTTKGTSPRWVINGACTSSGHHLYVYGGHDRVIQEGSLHQLDVRSCTWTQLSAHTPGGPQMKSACRMVCYKNSLVLFGGWGNHSGVVQPGTSQRFEWTNELHLFDIGNGTWSFPVSSGTVPPPCCDFSFTMIDDTRVVLFGGYLPGLETSNDVYILDLRTMHWSKLDYQKGGPHPAKRSHHGSVCLGYGGDHPQLLVTGGWGDDEEILSDMWILDLHSQMWREVSLSTKQPRRGHCVAAFSLSPRLTEVVIFGGNAALKENYRHVACTSVLQLEYQNTSWILTDVTTNSSQCGSFQRIRDKMNKITQSSTGRDLAAAGEVTGRCDTEKREAEKRAMGDEKIKWEMKLKEAEKKSQESVREVEKKYLNSEERSAVLEMRVRECEEQLDQLETQWVIQRSEIQLTGPELGRGGWATVSVALFRGTRVAAKSIHNQIISHHNRQLFIREMNMAARIRHPNLVQFVGATQEGEMIILTELMPTSLRRELEREHRMSTKQVRSISLDVVRALNYLHLMKPDPIIHRDISSANVLLEPAPNDSWKAKVTDYGSVNFLQRLQTVGPGNPTYAAPEANDPSLQSPKMDIFSFGILLIEMLTGELPPSNARYRTMGSIQHTQLLTLIRRCLSEKRENRPSASDMIVDIQTEQEA